MPADFAPDERLLIKSDLPGTMQLFRVPPLEQVTEYDEPVAGRYVPGTERILLERDEGGNERIQLYLLNGEPKPLVVEPEFIHRSPTFSRDGSLLAYACNRRNGVDFDVYVRSLTTGAERCVFDLGSWCDPDGFSLDGRFLAVHRETDEAGVDELHVVDLTTGSVAQASAPGEQASYGTPVWLDDGSFLSATNRGRDFSAVARYDGRWEVVLERDWDVVCVGDRDGRLLVVETNENGYSRLELFDARTLTRRREVELPGRGVAQELRIAPGGRLLSFQFASPIEPGDVWLCDTDVGELERLTGEPPPFDLVEPTLHRFPSFDGLEVPVYLYEPHASDGARPVVVSVHGGPEAQARPIFAPFLQYLVSRGYAVAVPNVRGSTGYGRRYEHLDDVRLRLDSVLDLAALHDWLGGRPGIDAARAVLYGRSYGGFMVLAGLAYQPERWAAGVEAVGISNLVTFLENTSAWRRGVREREYGSLAHDREFLEEISPLDHVEKIRAPLFIQHGANDPRVPVSESRQIHAALAARGVRCELLVHDDEGHGIGKLENRIETFELAAAFLDAVVGAA